MVAKYSTSGCLSPPEIALEHPTGRLHIRQMENGRYQLRGEARDPKVVVPHSPCVTDYPLPLIKLILDAYGAVFACDEISRDVDATEAALDVRHSVEAYFEDDLFLRPMRILDYGCGAGSSSVTLARLFPHAQVTGVDFVPKLLEIAEQRATCYGIQKLNFEPVDANGKRFQEEYDFVFLNAVYEHLLPDERQAVITGVWSALKPGGAMILNQTPHRWFPIETHTTGLPLVNYLPARAALIVIRAFCRRSICRASWPELLRAGARGATVGEIMRYVHRNDPRADRLAPIRLADTWAGIWYATKRARLHKVSRALRCGISAVQMVVQVTRLPLSPYISIAVVKSG